MWTVVYIAGSSNHAEKLKEILLQEGLLANIRPLGTSANCQYEILVPKSEASEAQAILCQYAIQ